MENAGANQPPAHGSSPPAYNDGRHADGAAMSAPPPGSSYPPPNTAGYPPQQAYPSQGYPPQGQQPAYPPQQGYPPQPQQGPAVVTVQQPATTQVVVTGNCPTCHAGTMQDSYTACGIILAICFFPLGIICCLMMKERRCSNCGARFG